MRKARTSKHLEAVIRALRDREADRVKVGEVWKIYMHKGNRKEEQKSVLQGSILIQPQPHAYSYILVSYFVGEYKGKRLYGYTLR